MKLFLLLNLILSISIFSENQAEYSLGLKPASYEMIAKIKEANPNQVNYKGIPSSYDLSPYMPPVGNQGKQESSVGWATAYALKSYQEFIERKDKQNWQYREGSKLNTKTLYSPSFIYNQINSGKDSGAYLEDALLVILSKGVTSLESMPYNQNDFKSLPNQEQLAEASNFRGKDFFRIRSSQINEIKHQISLGNPVLTGISVSENFFYIGKSIYNEHKGSLLGLQALVIVGYDDSNSTFKVMNSWGSNWGDKGYSYIDYRFFIKNAYTSYVLQDEIDSAVISSRNQPKFELEDINSVTEEISPPKEIFATNGNYPNKIFINWTSVKKAIGYEIHRSIADENSFQRIGLTQKPNFEDTTIEPDQAYAYKIISISEDDVSDLSDVTAIGFAKSDKKNFTPAKVTNLNASFEEYPDKIVLNWVAVENTSGYTIHKLDSKTKTYKQIGKTTELYYEDKSASKNSTETYIIAGMNQSITGIYSDPVVGKTSSTNKLPPPSNVIASFGQYRDKIIVKWNKVTGASNYLVYKYSKDKWESLPITNLEEIIDTNFKKGENYYTVVALDKNNQQGSFSKLAIGYVDTSLKRGGYKPEPPTGVTARIEKITETATISWSPVELATEYNVWEKKQGDSKWKFKQRLDASNLFYTFQIKEKETFYLYSVTSKTVSSIDSEYSNIATVVLSDTIPPVRTRGFGNISKLEKFKGTWTAIQWDSNTGSKNVVMEISATQGNEFIIKFDNKKTLKGSYIPGSPSLEVEGRVKIKLGDISDALSVELNDKSLVNDKMELSFLKE
jgi:C1A family cysteine protease